jgi:hypothetical protein
MVPFATTLLALRSDDMGKFMNTIKFIFLAQIFFPFAVSFAAPWGLPLKLNDKDTEIDFEVFAPWNIVDGKAEEISGDLKLNDEKDAGSLRADIAVKSLDYSAGIRPAGQLVASWLRSNPPTPARFVISKTTLACAPESLSLKKPCKGTVDGQLTIWGKEYFIDIPIEIKNGKTGPVLEGFKEIKFGQYGFGDPSSTIAKLKPSIELKFTVTLSAGS